MERKWTPTNTPTNGAAHTTALQEDSSPVLQNQEEIERVERVWAERAIQLAKVDTSDENQGAQVTVVLVRLGRELLGLDVQNVFDIRNREAITRVPRVPGWVVGVTNLRGNILSVIDLCKYFGLPGDPAAGNAGEENHGLLVIVQSRTNEQHGQNGSMEIVFLVDEVLGIETLPVRQSAADSSLIHSLRQEYILFIGERKTGADAEDVEENITQRHVVVLNVENLLTDPRLIIHDEIA